MDFVDWILLLGFHLLLGFWFCKWRRFNSCIAFGFLVYRFLPSSASEAMPAGFGLSPAAKRSDRPEEHL